jgi:hypothetical protein
MKYALTALILLCALTASWATHAGEVAEGDDYVPTPVPVKGKVTEPPFLRVATSGAEFKLDKSHPLLGVAYRDPSGLIWGELVKKDGQIKVMKRKDAEKYCKSLGARLPTIGEIKALGKFLGKDSPRGYDPYLADGKTEVFPGLASQWIWLDASSAPSFDDTNAAWGGEQMANGKDNNYNAVRCVTR